MKTLILHYIIKDELGYSSYTMKKPRKSCDGLQAYVARYDEKAEQNVMREYKRGLAISKLPKMHGSLVADDGRYPFGSMVELKRLGCSFQVEAV